MRVNNPRNDDPLCIELLPQGQRRPNLHGPTEAFQLERLACRGHMGSRVRLGCKGTDRWPAFGLFLSA